MVPLLEIEDLHINIATEKTVLKPVVGVDLVVESGQTLAIVGESGSGKSLTAMSIMGLLPHRSRMRARSIRFSDKSLLGLSKHEWQSIRGNRISMIFQDPMTALDPYYTIGAQMLEILHQHWQMAAPEAKARAVELLDTTRIPSPKKRFNQHPHELSGGLRQRVMIAMSLLCEPELLIADEPTTALDVTTQAQILELLSDVQKKSGVGLIIITHDLGVVAHIADQVAVMYCGQIVEFGPTKSILSQPRHPYTEGLLHSILIPGQTSRDKPLGFIPGLVPPPTGEPNSCKFAPRCPYATAECLSSPIEMHTVNSERSFRCVLPPDGSGLSSETSWRAE